MRSPRTSSPFAWLPGARTFPGRPSEWHPPIRLIGLLDQLVGRLALA